MADLPRTRYAKNGDVHIAYQVVGEGDLDILLIDTWVHHVEAPSEWEAAVLEAAGSDRPAVSS